MLVSAFAVTVSREELEDACAQVIAAAAGTVRQVIQSYRQRLFLASSSPGHSGLTAAALGLPAEPRDPAGDSEADDIESADLSDDASQMGVMSGFRSYASSIRSAKSYASSAASVNTDVFGNWLDKDSDSEEEDEDDAEPYGDVETLESTVVVIDEVVLVGGSSRIPGVRQGLLIYTPAALQP